MPLPGASLVPTSELSNAIWVRVAKHPRIDTLSTCDQSLAMRNAILLVAGLVLALPARADLRSGDDKLLHGDYAEAITAYREVIKKGGRDAARAQVQLGRALLVTGDHAGARAAAEAASKDRGAGADAKVLLAEVHRAGGRPAESRALLEEVVKKEPRHLRARAQLGLVHEETGEKKLADALWNKFYDDYDA